jgi:hypothetical protein
MDELTVIRSPRSGCGHLASYQNRLADKLRLICSRLEAVFRAVASEATDALQARMTAFTDVQTPLLSTRASLLSSVGETEDDYEAMRARLLDLNQRLVAAAQSLRVDSLALYDAAFEQLQPAIDSAFAACAEWKAQLPAHLSDKLECEVQHVTQNYLQTKQALISKLYEIEAECESGCQTSTEQFLAGGDSWKEYRSKSLLASAKAKLSLANEIDFTDPFEDFADDQEKFTQCYQTELQNIQIILPPDRFTVADLDTWFEKVMDLADCQENFMSQFLLKTQAKIDERAVENAALIDFVRAELLTLCDPQTAESEVAWLPPLERLCAAYYSKFAGKLTAYRQNRLDAVRQSFQNVHDFLEKAIAIYDAFASSMREEDESAAADLAEFEAEMTKNITDLEAKLSKTIAQIQVKTEPNQVSTAMASCKDILGQIEAEYRRSYDRSLERLSRKKPLLLSSYEETEAKLLEHLHLKKFAPNASKGKAKSASPKSPRRSSALPEIAFGFALPDGSHCEEISELVLLPPLDDFVDDDDPAAAASKAGKPGKKAPPKKKPPAKKKGKVEEPEEFEVPEFLLFEHVPKWGNHMAILVPIPVNSSVSDYANRLREEAMNSLVALYESLLPAADFPELRKKLAVQLSERLRTHGPRVASLELNVGEPRMLQIHARSSYLDRYFRTTTTNFNAEYLALQNSVAERRDLLDRDCEKLRVFIGALAEQPASPNLTELSHAFKAQERAFGSEFTRTIGQLKGGIEKLIQTFQTANQKFLDESETQDPPFSKEESETCARYMERFNTPFLELTASLQEEIAAVETEIAAARDSIVRDFDTQLPIHRADVAFLEALANAQREGLLKFKSLRFSNRQAQDELALAITAVQNAQNAEGTPGSKVNKLFEAIDLLRLRTIRLAEYLGVLKSPLPTDPFVVEIELKYQEPEPEEGEERKRKGRRTTGSDEAPKVPTFQGCLDAIGADVMSSVNGLAQAYYKQLKARQFDITRSAIAPSQKQCAEDMKAEWAKGAASAAEIIEATSEVFRRQVLESVTAARAATAAIFDCLSVFYETAVVSSMSEVRVTFEHEIAAFERRRIALREKLTPQLADPNRSAEFSELLKQEEARAIEENSLINSYAGTVAEMEKTGMKNFIGRLPIVVRAALSVFDVFPVDADLACGAAADCQRATMAQMLREDHRLSQSDEPMDEHRPFRRRNWPQLNTVMAAAERLGGARSSGGSKNGRAKRLSSTADVPPKKMPSAEDPGEKTPLQNSLDTTLTRGVIIERNRCYEHYEREFSERVQAFTQEMDGQREKTNAQNTTWRLSVLSLKPETVFPPL